MNSSPTTCPALLADRFNTLRYDRQRRVVVLLDRRRYPFATEFVECPSTEAVAEAIEAMVVQGGPPLAYAAGLGLALAAFEARDERVATQRERLQAAARRLVDTRPTADDLSRLIATSLREGEAALDADRSAGQAVLAYVESEIERGNEVARRCGAYAAELLADGDQVLTHCFAGAALAWMLWLAANQRKHVRLIATETRPYLQGARLTAATARELDVSCTLITDGMPAALLARGQVTHFVCAADRIALDGHIANKVGTYAIALAAHRHRVPFYVLGYDGPDPATPSGGDIPIESRQADELFHAQGVDEATGEAKRVRTAVHGVDGYYPAFDVTPPDLITAVVTDRGVFEPASISRYLQAPTSALQSSQ